jgi:hypothetical protein
MVLSPPEVAEYCQQHPGISGLLFVETPDGHALLCYGSAFSHIPDSSR